MSVIISFDLLFSYFVHLIFVSTSNHICKYNKKKNSSFILIMTHLNSNFTSILCNSFILFNDPTTTYLPLNSTLLLLSYCKIKKNQKTNKISTPVATFRKGVRAVQMVGRASTYKFQILVIYELVQNKNITKHFLLNTRLKKININPILTPLQHLNMSSIF